MNQKTKSNRTERMDPGDSIKRAHSAAKKSSTSDLHAERHQPKTSNPYDMTSLEYSIAAEGSTYSWYSAMDRINIIREGLPYAIVQKLSKKLGTTIKEVLELLGIPQTTYNKKRRDKAHFNERDSELILHIVELMGLGESAFNHEKDKFHRWLNKPNPSLGGHTPMSLLDSNTGVQEVRNCLNRIEYGNMA